MRSVIAIVGGLFFVAALGATPLFAQVDYISGCVPQKKNDGNKKGATLKRVALGTSPGKDCKNNNEPVTLPTDAITDGLQTQVSANAGHIDTNTGDIAMNAGDISDNTDMINAIKNGGISSMIGGAHGTNVNYATNKTLYFPMTSSVSDAQDTEAYVQARLSATGWITDFAVQTNATPDTDNDLVFVPRVNGVSKPLIPLIPDQCHIGDSATHCEATGCIKVNKGDLLDLQLLVSYGGTTPARVRPTRVTARFVETDADCPPNKA